jgi:hypothetical protein
VTGLVQIVAAVDRAVRAAVVGVPALVLGYCAGRLRNDARDEPYTHRQAELGYPAGEEDLGADADLPLARDLHRRIEPVSGAYEDLDRQGS